MFKASKFAIFKNKTDKSSLKNKKIYAKKSGYLNVLIKRAIVDYIL